ncbi:MAG: lysylphosphatidylglycerol synthase transmembrane domain-containing protein [Lachnospiraceae bacterium]
MGKSLLYTDVSKRAEVNGRNPFESARTSDIISEESFEATYGPGSEEDRKRKRRSRIIWTVIFFIVNGGVIAYIAINEFSREHPDPLGYKFHFSNVMFIVAGFLCIFLALAFETVKYVVMMDGLGEKISIRTAFETAALGKYYDSITPTGAGGQPFQIYYMHKQGYDVGVSAAMPLAAFLFMQLAFVLLAILTFIFKGDAVETIAIRIPAFVGIIFYSAVPFFIILFAISDKIAKKPVLFFIKTGAKLRLIKNAEKKTASVLNTFEKYQESIKLIARKKNLIVKLFILSFLYQLAICSIPFFVLHAYRGTGSYIDILAMTVFIYCAITIIPTPGNSGAAEGSFYLIFSQLDYSGLFWGMLIWRFICYYTFIIIGALIYGFNALERQLGKRKAKT